MPQEFDLRINNKSVITESGTLRTYFDRPCHILKASIPLTPDINAGLVDDMAPYKTPPAKLFLENELAWTGKITDPAPLKTASTLDWSANGSSLPFNFVDSHLEPPYELNKPSSQDIAKFATDQTGTAFIFEDQQPPPAPAPQPLSRGSFPTGAAAPSPIGLADSISGRETVRQGETGFDFCARTISVKRNMVMGCTPQGWLIFRQPDLKSPVIGTIEEGVDFRVSRPGQKKGSTLLDEYQANFDLRKRFRTVKAITDTKNGYETATTEPSFITEPRHKIITIANQIPGGVQANADWQLNMLAIRALTKEFNLIGWRLNGKLIAVNQRITIVSPTMGIPDGFTFFINSVEYDKRATTKGCKIGVIPPNAYTNQTVVEPYFRN